MKLLVFPRDPNPYQGLLYGEMQRLGVHVSYIGGLTPSRTLNLLLLPLELAARRMSGARVIHLHWVFAFGFPGGRRFNVMRRMAYVWFLLWLRSCRVGPASRLDGAQRPATRPGLPGRGVGTAGARQGK